MMQFWLFDLMVISDCNFHWIEQLCAKRILLHNEINVVSYFQAQFFHFNSHQAIFQYCKLGDKEILQSNENVFKTLFIFVLHDFYLFKIILFSGSNKAINQMSIKSILCNCNMHVVITYLDRLQLSIHHYSVEHNSAHYFYQLFSIGKHLQMFRL